jgi:hypothetical protein
MSRALIVPGHGLVSEGLPHDDEGYPLIRNGFSHGGTGRAKCSCGTLSEILDSANKRKQWHRDHKNQILGDKVLEEIKAAGSFEEWRDQQ